MQDLPVDDGALRTVLIVLRRQVPVRNDDLMVRRYFLVDLKFMLKTILIQHILFCSILLLRSIYSIWLIFVIFEAFEQILVNRGGLFVLQLGANRIFGGIVIFQVSIFVARTLQLFDLVDRAELGLEILVDKFLVNLVGQVALILEADRARQIVLVASVVVHASAPLFADGKLFRLRSSRRES